MSRPVRLGSSSAPDPSFPKHTTTNQESLTTKLPLTIRQIFDLLVNFETFGRTEGHPACRGWLVHLHWEVTDTQKADVKRNKKYQKLNQGLVQTLCSIIALKGTKLKIPFRELSLHPKQAQRNKAKHLMGNPREVILFVCNKQKPNLSSALPTNGQCDRSQFCPLGCSYGCD